MTDGSYGAFVESSSAEMQRRVSAMADRQGMSRRQRQIDQLRDLCCAGALVRAIDLAFEHFAHFGRDDEIIDLLAHAVEDTDVAGRAHQRFAELCASGD